MPVRGGLDTAHTCMRCVCTQNVYGAADAAVWKHAMSDERWKIPPVIEELKAKAKSQGLWNLWMAPYLDPKSEHSPALKVEEYAPLAEIMGAVPWASEIFNCSAPDTGNMEVLIKYGTTDQKERFLTPLMNGAIRSCFAMTEKEVNLFVRSIHVYMHISICTYLYMYV